MTKALLSLLGFALLLCAPALAADLKEVQDLEARAMAGELPLPEARARLQSIWDDGKSAPEVRRHALLAKSFIHKREGRLDLAIEDAHSVLLAYPEAFEAPFAMAFYYAETGNFARPEELMERCSEIACATKSKSDYRIAQHFRRQFHACRSVVFAPDLVRDCAAGGEEADRRRGGPVAVRGVVFKLLKGSDARPVIMMEGTQDVPLLFSVGEDDAGEAEGLAPGEEILVIGEVTEVRPDHVSLAGSIAPRSWLAKARPAN